MVEVQGVGVEAKEEEEQVQEQGQEQGQEQVEDFELSVKETGSTHLGRLVCRNAHSTTDRSSWRNNNGLDKSRHTSIDNFLDRVH